MQRFTISQAVIASVICLGALGAAIQGIIDGAALVAIWGGVGGFTLGASNGQKETAEQMLRVRDRLHKIEGTLAAQNLLVKDVAKDVKDGLTTNGGH